MWTIKSKRLVLRNITKDDLPILFEWRNSGNFIKSCSIHREKIKNIKSFEEELQNDFIIDRHLQFMIFKKSEPIGTIYSYNFNPNDGNLFITTFLSNKYTNKGYGIEAFALFALFLFEEYKLFKIYTETYSKNRRSLNILERSGFVREGYLKGHRIYKDERLDLIILSLFRSDFNDSKNFINKILM